MTHIRSISTRAYWIHHCVDVFTWICWICGKTEIKCYRIVCCMLDLLHWYLCPHILFTHTPIHDMLFFLLQKKAIRIGSKKPKNPKPLFIQSNVLKYKLDYNPIQIMCKAKNRQLSQSVQMFKMRDSTIWEAHSYLNNIKYEQMFEMIDCQLEVWNCGMIVLEILKVVLSIASKKLQD